MAQGNSIVADLFKRQSPGPTQPIKRLRIKQLLTEPLVVVPGGHVVRSEAYARELVGLAAANPTTLSAAADKLRERPEITEARIATDLTGKQVSVNSPSIAWRFDTRVATEITIVQSNYSGDAATIVIDVKSETGPRSLFPRKTAGKLRLHYEWELGWTLAPIENLDFKEQ